MSLEDAAYCLDELAAGRIPQGARLMVGAQALDTLRQRGTIDRLLLDAATGLATLATGGELDLDETGRKRAGEMAHAARRRGNGASRADKTGTLSEGGPKAE